MKKYIITSYIPDAVIDYDFYSALEVYSKKNKAEMIVTQNKFNYVKDLETDQEEYNQKFIGDKLLTKERKLAKSLFISDYQQSINVIDPLSGMESVASHKGSFILSFPRHRFKSVARVIKNHEYPRGIWCTGSISEPVYKTSIKSGMKMQPFHVKGALVVTIENNKIFHIRQLQWDGVGFYDLNTYYMSDKSKVVKTSVSAFVCGDDHAVFQNEMAMKVTKRHIKQLRPSNIVRHDTLDCCSISHHVENKKLTKASIDMTLEEELKITAKTIKDFEDKFPFANHYQVASNHPEHLDRYLDEARYRDDNFNHILALELALAKSKGNNVYKYSMEKYAGKLKTNFLTRKSTIKIEGIEIAAHGDMGVNGGKATPTGLGLIYSGKAITGHSHSANISPYGNPTVGTLTDLVLPYTSEAGGSSWSHTNCIVYKNGKMSLINILPNSQNKL